ncbi:hypothetical vacuole protein, conserved [Candida dubliniensis CD36]|uniref:Hypothetical vacuole protein, conserved n=1 Tax=Candida dubliniensis (strain CD36 / ATCC MYA-646 / CBS 7987 / NCPF 3949 / NRRL Y-17841) TaxID=573826 RepID=B9WAQ4_CANDC|nr:hypothetical vacuole protein, conserved [Candida dubliniensis CD36]CAX43474.1 hypothetical vacuole protein, conserved [Candida dubliniensis CD36]
MKVSILTTSLLFILLTNGATILDDYFPKETPAPTPTLTTKSNPELHISPSINLFKRIREVIINKDYAKNQAAKTQSSSSTITPPPKWVRTLNDGKVEIVTPTIIEGVTFNAQPPTTTNGLEYWVSLKDDGSPKTIKPQMKNGQIKNGRPDYSTWFQTATTIVYNKEQLKAHNMADDEIFEEIKYIPESDLQDHLLNPIIRCTPDRYKKKGIGKDKSTEPFCTPKDDARLTKDKTYFITWYSRFFDENKVNKVRIHLSNIKESLKQKGLKKRQSQQNNNNKLIELIDKRSKVLEMGGKVEDFSFFSSDWISNDQGYYPLFIDENWFGSEYWKKILISIQPDNIPNDQFNFLENSIVVEIWKGVKVSKDHLIDLKKLEEKYSNRNMHDFEIDQGIDFEKYMIMMALPTCVLIFGIGMWLFVTINKIDLSNIKKRKFARENTTHKKIPFKSKKKINKDYDYDHLPQFNTELDELKHD